MEATMSDLDTVSVAEKAAEFRARARKKNTRTPYKASILLARRMYGIENGFLPPPMYRDILYKIKDIEARNNVRADRQKVMRVEEMSDDVRRLILERAELLLKRNKHLPSHQKWGFNQIIRSSYKWVSTGRLHEDAVKHIGDILRKRATKARGTNKRKRQRETVRKQKRVLRLSRTDPKKLPKGTQFELT